MQANWMVQLLFAAACFGLASAVRVHDVLEMACSKVQARWLCKLPSEGWSKEEASAMNDESLRCVAQLCGNNIGNCCEKRTVLIDAGIDASRMPVSAEGLKEFDHDPWGPAWNPIKVDVSDQHSADPTCPGGKLPVQFGTFGRQFYVPWGKHHGDVYEERCGFGSVDPEAMVKFECQKVEMNNFDTQPQSKAIWKVVEGTCEEERGCQATEMTFSYERDPENPLLSREKMKFNLPFQKLHAFGQKAHLSMPCPLSSKVTGGYMDFYCRQDGRWESGEDHCEWADKPEVAQQQVAPHQDGCNTGKFSVTFPFGVLKFDLPPIPATMTHTAQCSSKGAYGGSVNFKCNAEKKWELEGGSCYQEGMCNPSTYTVTFNAGPIKFSLPSTPVSQRHVVDCASMGPYKGEASFSCTPNGTGGKWQLDKSSQCKVAAGNDAPVVMPDARQSNVACPATDLTVTLGDDKKVTLHVPAGEAVGLRQAQPCGAGYTGALDMECSAAGWQVKGGSCHKAGVCETTRMTVTIGGEKHPFELPETGMGDTTAQRCSEGYSGTLIFKCQDEGWKIESGTCKKEGMCGRSRFSVGFSFGSIEFTLPAAEVSQEHVADCSSMGPYSGQAVFTCDELGRGGKWHLDQRKTKCAKAN